MSIFKKINFFFRIVKRINQLNKEKNIIIFYSENKSYQKYSNTLIKSLLKNKSKKILYISSDESDKIDQNNIENIFIGNKYLIQYFFLTIKADAIFLTITDLNNHIIKKTKNIKKYIYYFHAPASTTKIYTETAFDNYDIILCNGDYQYQEIKKSENLRRIKKKELIKTGYFYFDYLNDKLNASTESNEILIAPSWNYNNKNYINENFELIISELLQKKITVRFRPHPEVIKRSRAYLEEIQNRYSTVKFIYDDNPENFSSMEKAYCLITDNSAIAIEYILILKKPVLYFNDVDKIHNNNFHQFNELYNIDDNVREKFGVTFKKDEIDQIELLIKKSEMKLKNNKHEINNFLNQNFYNFGKTAIEFEKKINEIL